MKRAHATAPRSARRKSFRPRRFIVVALGEKVADPPAADRTVMGREYTLLSGHATVSRSARRSRRIVDESTPRHPGGADRKQGSDDLSCTHSISLSQQSPVGSCCPRARAAGAPADRPHRRTGSIPPSLLEPIAPESGSRRPRSSPNWNTYRGAASTPSGGVGQAVGSTSLRPTWQPRAAGARARPNRVLPAGRPGNDPFRRPVPRRTAGDQGRMSTLKSGHSCTLLGTGRVVWSGGRDVSCCPA